MAKAIEACSVSSWSVQRAPGCRVKRSGGRA